MRYFFLHLIFLLNKFLLQEFEEAIKQSLNLKVLSEIDNNRYTSGANVKLIEVLCSLLDPFLECYHTVCIILLQVMV